MLASTDMRPPHHHRRSIPCAVAETNLAKRVAVAVRISPTPDLTPRFHHASQPPGN